MPRLVLYPLLGAVYPVLTLAAGNPGEIPGLWVLIWPLGISLFVSLGAWVLLSVFIRDPDRRAFLTLLVVVVFAWYGYFTIGLTELAWAAPYADTALPLLFIVAYLAGVTYLVFRLVPSLRGLTRFLTIFTAILVVWSTAGLLRQTTRWTGLTTGSNQPNPAQTSVNTNGKTGPDIYLIVLDKYTGSQSLRDNYGFDNADFETFLVRRGFVLPRTAQANYIYTTLSLASLLNYRYLDDLPVGSGQESHTKTYVNHLVEDNAVWRFLQAHHYRFIFFPTRFPVTWGNRFADLQVPDPRRMLSEFEIVWRRTTLAEPVFSWICQRFKCAAGTPLVAYAKLLEWKFDQLSQVPKWPREGRSLFVFAHITIPHEPYVFNADCSIRPPFWPSPQDEAPEKQAYIAQITCLNRRLETIVEHLLRDSPSPPVILLQSDHGHGRMPPLHIPDVDAVTPDRVAERANVFAAYHLPGADRGIVYDSITPVNVFRTVFRQYFRADLPPLPDQTYWSPETQMFKFTRVRPGQAGQK